MVLPFSSFSDSPALRPAHDELLVDLVEVEDVRRAAVLEHHVVRDVDQRRHRRWPQRARRSTIHAGVLACVSTPRTTRPEKRPHRSVACDLAPAGARRCVGGTGCDRRRAAAARRSAPPLRARRRTRDRQWPRLGVSFSVNSVSSSFSAWRTSAPSGASSASSSRPPWSSDKLQLARRAQHAEALDAAQLADLDVERLAVVAGGSAAPTSASGTRMPTRAFGAPQTICSAPSRECAPACTWHTRSLSALGCGSHSTISPTTTPRERRRHRAQVFDFHARHRQQVGQLRGGQRRIAELAQPGFGELHRRLVPAQLNCDRKRRSPSKNRRRSSMP